MVEGPGPTGHRCWSFDATDHFARPARKWRKIRSVLSRFPSWSNSLGARPRRASRASSPCMRAVIGLRSAATNSSRWSVMRTCAAVRRRPRGWPASALRPCRTCWCCWGQSAANSSRSSPCGFIPYRPDRRSVHGEDDVSWLSSGTSPLGLPWARPRAGLRARLQDLLLSPRVVRCAVEQRFLTVPTD